MHPTGVAPNHLRLYFLHWDTLQHSRLLTLSWNTHGRGCWKAATLQHDYLQEICLLQPPGQPGQANTLVPGRESAAGLEQLHGLPPGCAGHPLWLSLGPAILDAQVTQQLAKPCSLSSWAAIGSLSSPLFTVLLHLDLVLAVRYMPFGPLYCTLHQAAEGKEKKGSLSWPGLAYSRMCLSVNMAIICLTQPLHLIVEHL